MSNRTLTYTLLDNDSCEEEVSLPAKWVICHHCSGNGKSCAHLGAFTGEEMAEDPDFAEDYFAGVYDRPCTECHALGRILVIDRDRANPELLARVDANERRNAECDAIQAAEYRAEMGWAGREM